MSRMKFVFGLIAASTMTTGALAADDVVLKPAKSATIDYANAKAMPLPTATNAPATIAAATAKAAVASGPSGATAGFVGNGKTSPVTFPAPKTPVATDGGFSSQAYGTSKHPYTTALADASGLRVTSAYPYSAAGKLFFKEGTDSYVCSASLIKRGLVVTAAHCVMQYGSKTYYTGHVFVPGYYESGSTAYAPFGQWKAAAIVAPSAYFNGTDVCADGATGVVCQNDVAVIALKSQSSAYPGTKTGYFGYAYGTYSYADNKTAQITQLGYPVALNYGGRMERTDSTGFVDSTAVNNTVIGSQQTGGSSGGPWLVNFGMAPTITGDAGAGQEAARNRVVGVTSWGYTNSAVQEQGASLFTSTNIAALVSRICNSTTYKAVCQ